MGGHERACVHVGAASPQQFEEVRRVHIWRQVEADVHARRALLIGADKRARKSFARRDVVVAQQLNCHVTERVERDVQRVAAGEVRHFAPVREGGAVEHLVPRIAGDAVDLGHELGAEHLRVELLRRRHVQHVYPDVLHRISRQEPLE
jgi:hypothetical protein